jgi:hypothetical protein
LRRDDKSRQAISYALAATTQQWWRIDGQASSAPSERYPNEPVFDAQAIARREQRFVANDRNWQDFFSEAGIEPLVIRYEELASEFPSAIRKVLRWLEVPTADSVDLAAPRLRRQSNERNEEWLARYTAIKRAGTVAPLSDAQQPDPPAPDHVDVPRALPHPWREWVLRSWLAGKPDRMITQVLTQNGYSTEIAHTEMERLTSDPSLPVARQVLRQQRKAEGLLRAQGRVACLDSRAKHIDRREQLSPQAFRDEYYSANRPVILRRLLSDWPAMSLWTPGYLKRMAGQAVVEIMMGREASSEHEGHREGRRSKVTFADYVDKVFSDRITNDYYMVANNRFLDQPGSAALLQDCPGTLPYLSAEPSDGQRFLWFGPAGTVTRLHHDTSNILLAQIRGRKRYHIVPASQWDCVYNRVGVFSDVDAERPDLRRFPKFHDATVINEVIEPGEVLFMPVGWWHQVRALDVSITVTFTNFILPNRFLWE